MFRPLVVNTAISAAAYLAISVVGLIVVPVLLAAYGLTLFGLIALARLWMPTGVLGILDLGVGETATLSVARARATSEWKWASDQVAWLVLMAGVVGITGGIGLFFGADALTGALKVPVEQAGEFAIILQWTAAALPLLFGSLVAEGIVKGFEEYSTVRAIEVLSSLIYGIGSLSVVWLGGSYADVAYLAVAANVLRAVVSMLAAGRCLWRSSLTVGRWHRAGLADCWQLTRLMATNKMLGTSQVQAAPVLVGLLVGPAGVGVYDVLVRLPRFAKSVLGLVNSALLPFAARLEAGERTADLCRLGAAGLPIVAVITMPPLMAAATFSEPILRLWLGPALASYWPWQALMFVVPILTVLVGFGATALLSRRSVPGRMNRMLAVQLCLQFLISIALVQHLQERAFILGQVAAMAVTFYWQMRLVLREQGLGVQVVRRLATVAGIGFALSAASLPFASGLGSIWDLAFAASLYTVTFWLVTWWLLPSKELRSEILNRLTRARG